MDFEYKEHYKYLTNICLNLTDACNFECRYCFVEQNPHYMTLEVAKKAVHYILDNLEKKKKLFPNNRYNKCSITYFGGEPTLMWDSIIVPLTNYIRENNYPIDLGMTTNASLLNQERIDYMKKNNMGMLLSMDGNRLTQEFNRPCRDSLCSSFDLVEKNIPLILKYNPNVTYRATIFAPTAKYTFDNYIYAIQQGFKNIYLLPDARHPWSEEEKEDLHIELNKIYSYMSYCFSHKVQPPISFRLINKSFECILRHDIKVLHGTLGNSNFNKNFPIMRCGLGTSMGSIGYDGSIYGCQEQTSKGIKGNFYLGNIFKEGIEENLHKVFLQEFSQEAIVTCENPELCKNCRLFSECADQACPSTSYDLYQDFHKNTEINCLWNQWMLNNSMLMMEKYVTENNLIFKEFLDNNCSYKKFFLEREGMK